MELTEEQVVNISREILDPKVRETVIRTWAMGMVFGTAHEDPFMLAFLSLGDVGPANDHDGKRGAAMELKRRIEVEVLPHATKLSCEMKDMVIATVHKFKLET
jgi:hypothetical protein